MTKTRKRKNKRGMCCNKAGRELKSSSRYFLMPFPFYLPQSTTPKHDSQLPNILHHGEKGHTSSQTWPTGRGDILHHAAGGLDHKHGPRGEGTYFSHKEREPTSSPWWDAGSQTWPTGRGDMLHHKFGPRGEGTYFITNLARGEKGHTSSQTWLTGGAKII